MTGTVATQVKAIAFDRDIERLTEGFTGREWVFEEIDRWLQQGNERFFILTGEPGVGKSAIAAQLTQIRKDIAAYHFCIARQISTVEPNNVLLSLAAQLIKYFPDYGEALVNTVKPLFLQVKVEINIENIRDSVVQGVVIENLHIHYPKQALDIVLRQALEALPNPPREPVSILIDSLDEAVTYSNENNLVTLLSNVDDLPSWVRFILTSRPDKQRVLSYFETLKPYYYHLNELSEKNKKDIHQYVDGRVVCEPIQAQIQRLQVQSEALINQITELAKGNFLYTKVLLDDIELGGQPIDNLAALPKSLNELYHNFLLRLKAEWEGKYQPIFGILTVTKAPVTEEELTNLLSEQLDETELGQRLRIVQQFLDTVQNDYAENTYTLFHQSLQDYLTDKEKSGVFYCSPKDGHRQIIEYCWQYHPRDWRECDRYCLRYLAIHLVDIAALEKPPIKARKYIERLHELLATEVDGRNAWFDAKDRIGETAGFLADVELAWSQADEAYEREPEISLGLQCRYALIQSSLNSIGTIPIQLFLALVKHEKKQWIFKAIQSFFTSLLRNPDLKAKHESLVTLIKGLPKLDELSNPELLISQVWLSALAVTRSLSDTQYEYQALVVLAEELPPEISPEVLQEVLVSAQSIEDEASKFKVLIALADKLPEASTQVLEITQAIEDEKVQIKYLNILIKNLPKALLPQVLEIVKEIKDEYDRTQCLIALVERKPEALWRELLEVARQVDKSWYWYRDRFIGVLIEKLPKELLQKSFEIVNLIKDIDNQIESLKILIERLPERWLSQLLEIIRAIEDEYLQSKALSALADKIPEALLPRTLDIAQALENETLRSDVLISLAGILPEALLPRTLDIAQALENEILRSDVLISLADKLPEALPLALDIAQVFENEWRQFLIEKLARINAIKNEVINDKIMSRHVKQSSELKELAAQLPKALLPQALTAASSIEDRASRAAFLAALTNQLPKTLVPFPQILKIVQSLEYGQADILVALADKLPEALFPQVMEIVQSLNASWGRVDSLKALADKLPEKLFPQAFELAKSIDFKHGRAETLMALSSTDRLPEIFMPQALAIISQCSEDFKEAYIDECLVAIGNKLPEALWSQTLEAIQATGDEIALTRFLVALGDKLPKDVWLQAHAMAQSIKDKGSRAKALIVLGDKFPEALPEALKVALVIKDKALKLEILIALGDKFPDALPEALKVAQSIDDESAHSQLLIALGDEFPDALLEALKVIQVIRDEGQRIQCLEPLIEKLPEALIPQALEAVKRIEDKKGQTKCLQVLFERLPEALWPQLLEADAIKDEVTRANILIDLTDKLPEALPLAVETVQHIDSSWDLAEVLGNLAEKIPSKLDDKLSETL